MGGGNRTMAPGTPHKHLTERTILQKQSMDGRVQVIIRGREDSIKEGLGWIENWLRVLEGDHAG